MYIPILIVLISVLLSYLKRIFFSNLAKKYNTNYKYRFLILTTYKIYFIILLINNMSFINCLFILSNFLSDIKNNDM